MNHQFIYKNTDMSHRQSTYAQFTEEVHFLLPDTHVCMYFMDGDLQCVKHKTFFKRKSDRKKSFFALVIGTYSGLDKLRARYCLDALGRQKLLRCA